MKTINCNECGTTVTTKTTTEYCDLCRPHMNETIKPLKENTMETKLENLNKRINALMNDIRKEADEQRRTFKAIILNDLVEERKALGTEEYEHNYGVTSSFGKQLSKAEFYSDFSSKDDVGELQREGAQDHDAKFMEDEKNRLKADLKRQKAKTEALIEVYALQGIKVEGEAKDLLTEQEVCLREFPNARTRRFDAGKVDVALQRKSVAGYWYKFNKKAISYELEELFHVDEHGKPVALKTTMRKVEGKREVRSLLFCLVARYGYAPFKSFTYMDKTTGEIVNVIQEQRIVARSSAFAAGCVIDGERLEATVAPNSYTIPSTKSKEIIVDSNGVAEVKSVTRTTGPVESKKTYYGYDNLVQLMDTIHIMPSDWDESHGKASEKEFDEGILTGTSVATQALMSEDMAKEAIETRIKEERYLESITAKARVTVKAYINYTAMNDAELLDTKLGKLIMNISPVSYDAMNDAELQKKINDELTKHKEQARVIMSIAAACRRVTGRGLASPTWGHVMSMSRALEVANAIKEITEKVSQETLNLIDRINKEGWNKEDVMDKELITDEEVVSVREATLKYYRKSDMCKIKDAKVSNELAKRYRDIQQYKVS